MTLKMKEERWHPVFGRLTDPEEIAVFDRQQAREEYENAYQKAWEEEYEKAMQEEYERQCELEARLFAHVVPIVNAHPELEWTPEELAKEANCSISEAEHVLNTLNLWKK